MADGKSDNIEQSTPEEPENPEEETQQKIDFREQIATSDDLTLNEKVAQLQKVRDFTTPPQNNNEQQGPITRKI